MDQPRFVHLHLHSEYSLLDGAIRIDKLVQRVKELGMDAVAVTDHGNLHGALELYTKAGQQGVRPILGIEAYVAPGSRRERSAGGIGESSWHLVLLAENDAGWANLVRISSDAFMNGFYYRPRTDRECLARWADGLIALNGHLGSSLGHLLSQYAATGHDAHWRNALDEARWHAATFKPDQQGRPRFFVELQRHGTPEQDRINPLLVRLARELGLPMVADNDTHFLMPGDHDVHDSLCCISMGKTKDDPSRLRYSDQLYLKSPAEMAQVFPDLPEALENTALIADRCHVELACGGKHAPVVRIMKNAVAPGPAPRGSTEWFTHYCSQYELRPFDSTCQEVPPQELARQCDEALRDLCAVGLEWRYGRDVTPEARQRLDRELKVLAEKRISAYFLIVWDFVNEARRRGIPAAARGSGVGTMVGYALGLSNACPLRYGLLFERFTDPDRSEYPDIDVDICQDGRAQLIDYVRRKYGHVAQIITFGRLKARAAIKDIARVLGLPPSEGQRLSNFVPGELHITIEEALRKEPDFKAEYDADPTVRRVVDTARALEGHARHAGVHAAGVVIATQPLENIVPLYRSSGGEDVVTQWDGPTCEKMGLLKMDFLGLRTLSTLELARKLVAETLPEEESWRAVGRRPGEGAHPLDLDRLTFDDQRVFDLFRRADASGVFQFESPGMRRLLADLKPDRIEDLIAANALFRPGPMELIPQYTMRKHGRQPVPDVHPVVNQYTAETYGIMVYQEQVMQILHGLGDIPLRRAYTLIKAISKKSRSVIDSERSQFIQGASGKGLSQARADDLFNLILKFAGYGFNKCVAAETQLIDAQTGECATVGDLFERFHAAAPQPFFVHALGEDGQLRPRRVTDVVWNGVRPVFELVTRSGRRIVATDNHPFRTRDGWTNLGDLRPGGRIAAAGPVRSAMRITHVPDDRVRNAMAMIHGRARGLSPFPSSEMGTVPLRSCVHPVEHEGRGTVPKGTVPEAQRHLIADDGRAVRIAHAVDDRPRPFPSSLRRSVASSPLNVFWDEITSIEPAGIQDVYDLTVEGDHNFVADGLIVHNSHSTGYAIVAYETAYLKTYFPNQYMAALLTYESAARKVEEWVPYLEDCRQTLFPDHTAQKPHVGVEVKPPDVNLSEASFSVVFMPDEPRDACHGHVRFGLGAIRGASGAAINAIIEDRRRGGAFKSIFDFCERVDLRAVNRPTIEALVKSGAFDSVHGAALRAALLAAVGDAIAAGQSAAGDRRSGQMSFFGGPAQPATARPLPAVAPWDPVQTLTLEKEALGFHASGHPLDMHEDRLKRYRTHDIRGAARRPDKTTVRVGGVLGQVRSRLVRNGPKAGQKMAMGTLSDRSGAVEAVIFSDAFAKYGALFRNDAIVAMTGRIDRARGKPNVIVDQVIALDDLDRHLASRLELDLAAGPGTEPIESLLHKLEETLREAKANGGRAVDVLLRVHEGSRLIELRPNRLRVAPQPALIDRLREILGPDHVRLVTQG